MQNYQLTNSFWSLILPNKINYKWLLITSTGTTPMKDSGISYSHSLCYMQVRFGNTKRLVFVNIRKMCPDVLDRTFIKVFAVYWKLKMPHFCCFKLPCYIPVNKLFLAKYVILPCDALILSAVQLCDALQIYNASPEVSRLNYIDAWTSGVVLKSQLLSFLVCAGQVHCNYL